MIKSKISYLIVLILIIGFAAGVQAQQALVRLDKTGVLIGIHTEIRPSAGKEKSIGFDFFEQGAAENKDVIHRLFSDRESGIYFGYDLIIEFDENSGKYKISVEPLSQKPGQGIRRAFNTSKLGKGTHIIDTNRVGSLVVEKPIQSLPKYPAPVFIDEGDTVELNILENPTTQEKLFDVIKIISKEKLVDLNKINSKTEPAVKNSNQNFDGQWRDASKKPARDFNPETIELKLSNPKFLVNNKQIAALNGAVAGTIPYIYLQDRGIYAFSLFPRPGYELKKIGTVENNKISFEIDGNNYEIVSGAPIMETSGNWNLWVLYDSNYKTPAAQSIPYLIGAIDSLDNFFRKR